MKVDAFVEEHKTYIARLRAVARAMSDDDLRAAHNYYGERGLDGHALMVSPTARVIIRSEQKRRQEKQNG